MINAEDWEQQQKTLAILQDINLMEKIAKSMATHSKNFSHN